MQVKLCIAVQFVSSKREVSAYTVLLNSGLWTGQSAELDIWTEKSKLKMARLISPALLLAHWYMHQ